MIFKGCNVNGEFMVSIQQEKGGKKEYYRDPFDEPILFDSLKLANQKARELKLGLVT